MSRSIIDVMRAFLALLLVLVVAVCSAEEVNSRRISCQGFDDCLLSQRFVADLGLVCRIQREPLTREHRKVRPRGPLRHEPPSRGLSLLRATHERQRLHTDRPQVHPDWAPLGAARFQEMIEADFFKVPSPCRREERRHESGVHREHHSIPELRPPCAGYSILPRDRGLYGTGLCVQPIAWLTTHGMLLSVLMCCCTVRNSRQPQDRSRVEGEDPAGASAHQAFVCVPGSTCECAHAWAPPDSCRDGNC